MVSFKGPKKRRPSPPLLYAETPALPRVKWWAFGQ